MKSDKCVSCGQETILYLAGSPICVDCAELNDSQSTDVVALMTDIPIRRFISALTPNIRRGRDDFGQLV